MNKIWLVTQREYLTRVKNKTFILTTFLTPIGILLFMLAVGFVMSRGSDKTKTIQIYDPSHLLEGKLESRKNLTFLFSDESVEKQKLKYPNGGFAGILEVEPLNDSLSNKYVLHYHSDAQLALDETSSIEAAIGKKLRNYKLKKLDISEETLKIIDTDVSITPHTILEDKKISSITNIVSSMLGLIVSIAMFFIILLYGTQVMRSVMEEKINRIIEVLISSVKPFELMMGKVIGVGLVGLTQIGIWMILMPIIYIIGFMVIGVDPNALGPMHTGNLPIEEAMSSQDQILKVLMEIKSINWFKILPITLFYFIAGYFAYAALFAAVGSAVGEDMNEAQSLTMPVMMPLMFGFYIGISALNSPDSSLVVWASMIPLMSSIVMPVRLPFDPPWWQIGISMVSLLVFTVLFVWLAARIYRIGILMYGKKASFKELSKWIFYKG